MLTGHEAGNGGYRQAFAYGPPRRMSTQQIRMHGCASSKGGHIQQGRPAEARIRSLVAWIAEWRETETLKPIDNPIGRMGANHQAVARANAYVASTIE